MSSSAARTIAFESSAAPPARRQCVRRGDETPGPGATTRVTAASARACARRAGTDCGTPGAGGLGRRVDDGHQAVAARVREAVVDLCGPGPTRPVVSQPAPESAVSTRGARKPEPEGDQRPGGQHAAEVGRRVAAQPADRPDIALIRRRLSDLVEAPSAAGRRGSARSMPGRRRPARTATGSRRERRQQ